jgi:hypothetical protein
MFDTNLNMPHVPCDKKGLGGSCSLVNNRARLTCLLVKS